MAGIGAPLNADIAVEFGVRLPDLADALPAACNGTLSAVGLEWTTCGVYYEEKL